ncbi:hypothetical protein [Streptomyces sp. NBC_01304]|uniref:hypothetical protein n=1 Tax=Streptomyces sp. NBC_01304 TaxID=2903818 RepID=UPI002E15C7C6|nr:hypothetical protein OG430_24135 [Streptomyces sp. NBC_01304]
MRANRRTIRTAAIATGALAALALPAGAAFADASDAPATKPAPSASASPDSSTSETPEPTAPSNSSDPSKPSSAHKLREFVKTEKLADGSVAKVYKTAKDRFEAEIWANGQKLDTLVSQGGKPAQGENNGLHVTLQPNGQIKSWVEGGAKQENKPGKAEDDATTVKITMPDGRIAKLMDGPRVEISMPNGKFLGALDKNNPSTVKGGWTYKIDRSGHLHKFVVTDGRGGCSWVYDFSGKLIEKYTVKAGKHTAAAGENKKIATPKGGVKAGVEGVEAPTTGSAPLVAAGGGMAALGAAGLGFALLRRRTDG